jgi:hypothetical protein
VTGIDYRRLYDYRLKGTGQPARQAVWTEIAIYLHQRMGSPERVLDVGAGRGEFITAVPAAERWAIDLTGFGNYHDGAVKAIAGGITGAELPSGYFDGAVMSNLLEHLPTQETAGIALTRLRKAAEWGGSPSTCMQPGSVSARSYQGSCRTRSGGGSLPH